MMPCTAGKRRSLPLLEAAITQAEGKSGRALAYYRLGVFHDNNSREDGAIPNYLTAIRLGLPQAVKAEALAWLASSYYKTGHLREAMRRLAQSSKIASDPKLIAFLNRLEGRIQRIPDRYSASGR
jgi:tetratricopeptide (TPR) repeat protein